MKTFTSIGFFLCWVGVIPCFIFATAVRAQSPPEPTYDEKWMSEQEKTSPMLNLRNIPNQPDSPSNPEVDLPEFTKKNNSEPSESETNSKTDTPQQEQRSSDESKELGEKDPNQQSISDDTGDEMAKGNQPTGTDSEGSKNVNNKDVNQSKDNLNSELDRNDKKPPENRKARGNNSGNESTEESSSGSENISDAELNQNPINSVDNNFASDLSGPPLPGPEDALTPVKQEKKPVPSEKFPNYQVSSKDQATSDTGPLEAGMGESGSPWMNFMTNQWEWFMGGATVILGFLLFNWFNQSKVKVLQNTSRRVGDFFEQKFDTDKNSEDPISTPRYSIEEDANRKVMGSFNEAKYDDEIWEKPDDHLKELGIDPEYRKVLRLYYSKNLSPDQIADQTGRGKGEVGLILDMGKRVREEIRHGKGT